MLKFIFLALSLPLFAQSPTFPTGKPARGGKSWVEVYGDFNDIPQNFGRSAYRAMIHQVSLELMQQTNSLWLANERGWLTAVVISRQTADKLRENRLPISKFVRNLGWAYRLQYRGIDIQFSFEPAPAAMLELIQHVYRRLPRDRDAVLQHYQRNYVIRIYRAENVFNTQEQDINFDEALIAATLIGDSNQMLWGIHDGYDLFKKIASPQ